MMMIILYAMIISVFMYVELIEIKNKRLFINYKFKSTIQAQRGYGLRPKAVRKMLRSKWLHARISGGSEVMSKG